MIRINLIAERKRAVTARRVARPAGLQDLGVWLLFGCIVLGALATGGRYLWLASEIREKDQEIQEAQREAEALAAVIAEVERFKADKQELERKIQVITDLKNNQRGPVRILDAVSRALPDLLWLNRLDAKQNAVTVSGTALNPNAVANFLDNLDDVPEFQEPILKDIAQRDQLYNFTITFSFAQPATSAPAPAAAPSKPGRGTARR